MGNWKRGNGEGGNGGRGNGEQETGKRKQDAGNKNQRAFHWLQIKKSLAPDDQNTNICMDITGELQVDVQVEINSNESTSVTPGMSFSTHCSPFLLFVLKIVHHLCYLTIMIEVQQKLCSLGYVMTSNYTIQFGEKIRFS